MFQFRLFNQLSPFCVLLFTNVLHWRVFSGLVVEPFYLLFHMCICVMYMCLCKHVFICVSMHGCEDFHLNTCVHLHVQSEVDDSSLAQ